MLIRKLLVLFFILVLSNYSSPLETSVEVKLKSQYLPGIFPNFNLCQIFSPVSTKNDEKLFTGAKPNSEINQHVRYIVLHKCRWSSKQDTLYGSYLDKAYECEDTSFVQVRSILITS